jgi:hypothetical protein
VKLLTKNGWKNQINLEKHRCVKIVPGKMDFIEKVDMTTKDNTTVEL